MIIKAPINLELTQSSGQTSQPPWKFENDSYSEVVVIDNKPILFQLKQNDNNLNFDFIGNISNKVAKDKIKTIFDLDFNLNKFYKYLNNQSELEDLTNFCKDLRLFLAKDKFECLLSSICSANNSIARWTKSIEDIKRLWGNKYNYFKKDYFTFPDVSVIKNVYCDDIEEFDDCNNLNNHEICVNNLKACGVGYRAPYMKKASEIFTLEMDLDDISKMSYDEAFDVMLEIPGVGPKVADCILLYGFDFKQAFPTDVWIKRIVSYLYFDGKDINVSKIREFGMEEFGDYAGYVQLYLFHYARMSGLMKKLKGK
ncbi:DNA glycosylase [uncultured Methanobrevibacter sp.]|uniref:DNA glycosylase n=1 Tax=uncultured Methanobrevibacter sp. TaxID=253161 RepID=UPI002629D406|nr:DNA glycosylase [uncultured Methanobrevibacter sp.]